MEIPRGLAAHMAKVLKVEFLGDDNKFELRVDGEISDDRLLEIAKNYYQTQNRQVELDDEDDLKVILDEFSWLIVLFTNESPRQRLVIGSVLLI